MISMTIKLDGDNAWPDLRDKNPPPIHVPNDGPPIEVAVLNKGMESGRPSVCFRFALPDGQVVLAETSARLFCAAARAINAKFPHLFD